MADEHGLCAICRRDWLYHSGGVMNATHDFKPMTTTRDAELASLRTQLAEMTEERTKYRDEMFLQARLSGERFDRIEAQRDLLADYEKLLDEAVEYVPELLAPQPESWLADWLARIREARSKGTNSQQ